MPGGRPTKYKKDFCDQAQKFCLLGATNEDLAGFFEVTVSTVDKWIKEKPEFSGAIKEGRKLADANVGQRLYERATGYSHPEQKIFNDNGTPLIVDTIKHYPPDTTAAIFWLKNRKPAQWRDKQEVEHSGGVSIVPVTPEDERI